jgi:hypothetical protein
MSGVSGHDDHLRFVGSPHAARLAVLPDRGMGESGMSARQMTEQSRITWKLISVEDPDPDRIPITYPKRRGAKPIEMDTTPIPTNGRADKLGRIWWRGKQWAVTSDGIEALDGSYYIEAKRLLETMTDSYGGWLEHMGEKLWVDMEEFATAWLVALVLHGVRINPRKVRATVALGVVRQF